MADGTINESMVKVLSRRKRRRPTFYLAIGSGVLLVFLIAWFIGLYNSLVVLRQDAITARYQVDNSIQYRENLFPLLLEAVARFASHEDHIFDYTSDKRAETLKPQPPTREEIEAVVQGARSDWAAALSKIMAWAENYPDLKTSESFQMMMSKMSDVEQEIYEKRVAYNDAVNIYTSAIRAFPKNTLAYLLGFDKEPYYEISGKSEWRIDNAIEK
ncbi:LemA family protein [Candidatus Hydrogenedentota bacterium]